MSYYRKYRSFRRSYFRARRMSRHAGNVGWLVRSQLRRIALGKLFGLIFGHRKR